MGFPRTRRIVYAASFACSILCAASAIAAVDFTWSPSSPEIGEEVRFDLTGVTGAVHAEWSFGGAGCGGEPSSLICDPFGPFDCHFILHAYATSGQKTVSVTVKNPTTGATIGSASHSITVQSTGSCDDTPTCTYSISPSSGDLPAAGGVGTVTVSTSGTCPWSATTTSSWITIVNGTSRLGPGTFSYQVSANTGPARTGTISVENRTHTVRQEARVDCVYSLDPMAAHFEADGGAGSVTVDTAAGCQWTATSNRDWITITSGASGNGPGLVQYAVAANAGTARNGTIIVEGVTHSVSQDSSSGSPISTNFVASNMRPEVGEIVTFTVAEGVHPRSWELGSPNCAGEGQLVSCTSLPVSACDVIQWSYPAAGSYDVTLTSNAGARTKTLAVQDRGECVDECDLGGPPDATFLIDPSLATVGATVTFSHGPTTFEATGWHWIVSTDGATVTTNTNSSFTYAFDQPGFYEVQLVASNCVGSNTSSGVLEVQSPIKFLVPAAAHTPGLRDTFWKTDVTFFNPCFDRANITIEYLPEDINNTDAIVLGMQLVLGPKETTTLHDIVARIPGLAGEKDKGSLRVSYGSDDCIPLAVSRTYNDTSYGTFGQFIPLVPIVSSGEDELHLTGLVHNTAFRTNIGLANLAPEDNDNVTITLIDQDGQALGNPVRTGVPGQSTHQVVKIAEEAGVSTEVDIFSAIVSTDVSGLWAYGSVVDSETGDPVLVTSDRERGPVLYVPGVAHIEGRMDSVWRSDVTIYNSGEETIEIEMLYLPSEDLGVNPWMSMSTAPLSLHHYVDILGDTMLPQEMDSKGCLVVTPSDNPWAPFVRVKTYNIDPGGGTYGQVLKVFGEGDLIAQGEESYLPGVENSAASDTGFRTNVGFFNTDQDQTSRVVITLINSDGEAAADPVETRLAPHELQQFGLFERLGISSSDLEGTAKLTVIEGGAVAAYASKIDNRTQDSILIPQMKVRGLTQ